MATRREIIDVAWQLAQEKGLAGLTLRDVAERIGMRTPSLYSHPAGRTPPGPASPDPVHEEDLMNTTPAPWPGRDTVKPEIPRPTAMRLAETEYQRIADAVDAIPPEGWTLPTDCAAWDVRQLVAHVVGMAKFASTPLEMARQTRAAKASRHDGQALIDAQTAVQVAERDHLGPAELRTDLRRIGPRAAAGRRRAPGFVRRMHLPEQQIVNGVPERWSLGYVTDVILTRDPWMHRLDLARATGQGPTLTTDHDGLIVADVVLEWARRHAQPYRLDLTGPAGGSWRSGAGGEEIEMDAADFCRVVGGRPGPTGDRPSGLLTTQVPF